MRSSIFPNDRIVMGERRNFYPRDLLGCRQWVRADLNVTLNATTVSSWGDKSGQGNHLVQGTASKQPLFVASAQNGRPAARFDGVDDILTVAFTLNQPWTAYLVHKSIVIGASGVNDIVLSPSTAGLSGVLISDNFPEYLINAGASVNSAAVTANGVYAYTGIQFNGASSFVRVNGSQVASGNAGANNSDGITLGGFSNSTRCTNVEVAELAVFNRALNAGELAMMESYLKARYAL